MLDETTIGQLAAELVDAEATGQWIEPISDRYSDTDVEDAYRVGMAVASLKQARGRRIRGHKIGLTSKAMRDLMSATEPDYGFLYDNWFIAEGSTLDRTTMNRPLVEVELAFVMKSRLTGADVHAADVIRATDFVLPSIEIVDSRFVRRGVRTLIDSISDSASCGAVVLGGNPVSLGDIDPRRVSASLQINGAVVESGVASAVMGNPINAVAWLARKLSEFDVALEEGDVVLSGSFIRAVPFDAGDTVVALFDQLGEVVLDVGPRTS